MRFTVGQTYTFTRTLFTHGNGSYGSKYIPWADSFVAIQTVNLLCKEHHKVTNGWTDVKDCDGFIFIDPITNDVFHNQYPHASYGQLDDTNDRVVFLHEEDNVVFETDESGKVLHDADGKAVVKDQLALARLHSYFDYRMTLATTELSSIYRALHKDKRGNFSGDYELTKVQSNLLQAHLDNVISSVQAVSGKTVSFGPVEMTKLDGEVITLDKLWRATLA